VIDEFVIDESSRRYYLDVMGIQCWQLRDVTPELAPGQTQEAVIQTAIQAANNTDVIVADTISDDNCSQADWSQLETAIQQCQLCQLGATRKQAIAGRGNLSAELMFVLLSPVSDDDEAGVICSGEADDLFTKMLAAINITIDDVYITSLLKCKVPANHTVSPAEIKHCHAYLQQQIQLIQPKRLIVLGETAIRCLLQKNLTIDDFRAMNAEAKLEIESLPVFVSYSPQELLQKPEYKRKAWADLQQLQKMLASE
jgi:DNA polymerase